MKAREARGGGNIGTYAVDVALYSDRKFSIGLDDMKRYVYLQ